MNWWTVAPTVASFTAGLSLVAYALITWWPGSKALKKDPAGFARELAPFLLSYAYGMLLILGVGGVVGWLADGVVWAVGWVGDAALVYGVGGTRASVSGTGQTIALTNGGLMIVIIFTVVVVAVRKRRGTSEQTRKQIALGTFGGILTGTVAAVSSTFAIPLASAANMAGAWMNGVGQ